MVEAEASEIAHRFKSKGGQRVKGKRKTAGHRRDSAPLQDLSLPSPKGVKPHPIWEWQQAMPNFPLHCSYRGNGCCSHECFRLKQWHPELNSLSGSWEPSQTQVLHGSGVDGTHAAYLQAMGEAGNLRGHPPVLSLASATPAAAQPWPHWRHSSMRGRALTDFPANSFRKQIYCPRYVSHKYCHFPGGAIYLYLLRIAFELDIEPISMQ